MQRTRRRDTPPEIALRRAVWRLGLRYRTDFPIPGTRYRADFAFPRIRLAVFVDGCFWHGCPEHGTWPRSNAAWWRAKIEQNMARDARAVESLTALGWRVHRFWAHCEPSESADFIATAVSTAKSSSHSSHVASHDRR